MECFFGLTLGFVGFCFDMDLNFVEAQLCVGIPGIEFCRRVILHMDLNFVVVEVSCCTWI